jgi:hypothetical protein
LYFFFCSCLSVFHYYFGNGDGKFIPQATTTTKARTQKTYPATKDGKLVLRQENVIYMLFTVVQAQEENEENLCEREGNTIFITQQCPLPELPGQEFEERLH